MRFRFGMAFELVMGDSAISSRILELLIKRFVSADF